MKIKSFGRTGYVAAAMVVLPAVSLAATAGSCAAGKATPESYKWNFSREATSLLSDIHADAKTVLNRADRIQSFGDDTYISWQAHAGQLTRIKWAVNDMGQKLCRLETIRRMAAPWQQQAMDRAVPLVRLMADNAQDAITYLTGHQDELWRSTYQKYAANLYNEAGQLSRAVGQYEEYARVHTEDLHLGKALGMKTGS